MRFPKIFLVLVPLLAGWLQLAQAAEREVRIGVLSFRAVEQTRQQWQPTADYLNAHVRGYRFSIEPMFFPELDEAVNQRRFDFVLTNPEHYVETRMDHGLAAIATLMPLAEGHPVSSFGGVIFTRADRGDIAGLADVRGRTVASPGEQSLGGFLMQRWTLFKQGMGIGDLGGMRFTGMPQDRVVMEVLEGKADVGFVRTGVLESMAHEGRLRLDQVRVLNPQHAGTFPQLLSTELYPEWPFSAAAHTPDELSKAVMRALLEIGPDDEAARSGRYYGFTPPGNYSAVEAMMQRLGMLGMRPHDFDWRDVSRKYAVPLLAGTAALLLAVLATALYLWRNYRHLRRTYGERDKLALELSETNATLEQKVDQRTRELQSSEARFRRMFEHHASPMLLVDPSSGGIVDANRAAASFYGYAVEWMRQMNVSQINTLPPGKVAEDRNQALCGERNCFVFPHVLANGELRIVEVHSSPVEVEGKTLLFSVIHDITERHTAESKLRLRDAALNAAANAIIITDTGGSILWANQAFTDLTGYASGETLGRKPRDLLKSGLQDQTFYETLWNTVLSGQTWHGELVNHRKDGSLYNEEMTITPVKNEAGRVAYFIAVKQDISERKDIEAQMHDLAFYDPLTHLPNRRLLIDRLDKALAASSRSCSHGALMFLDLDHFKKLNDIHGHDVGDLLLVEVARRISGCIREEDSAARLGGDEFVIMLEDLSCNMHEAASQAEAVAEKIRAAIARPYSLKRAAADCGEAIEHYCTSSIGVTLFCDRDDSVEELLRWTDMAMYQAKTAGRNVIRFFDPAMQSAVEARVAMEKDLRVALETGQFRLYYQAQVNNSRRTQSAEALLRWMHPQRGLVAPMQFIPLAEETGLILPIGQWVLETACAQLAEWRADPAMRDLTLAVNVSAKQFRQADFVGLVKATVERHGINPLLLKLELTESTVLENAEDAIDKMRALKEYGVKLSLDDFGTGFSSLSHLKMLPLDQIKIDRSFVRDIATSNGDAVMVMTMVDLGMNFEVEVIAEGVETEEQFRLLQRYGCGSSQGYLFSRPVPLDQFEAMMLEEAGTVRMTDAR